MGVRLARAVDWTSRGCRVALGLSVAAVALGTARDWGYAVPLDVAIARALDAAAPTDALERRTRDALDAEDVALARGYADLAAELGRPLSPETEARLAAAEAPGASAWRSARGVARGFATGAADSPAALAGSVAADLTLVGDVRDLVGEGAKMARGEEHSDLLLGLAAAGIAATAATVASGGAAAPAKFAVSTLKAARRTGALTADLVADLGRTLTRATPAGPARAARTLDLRALAGFGAELRATTSVVGPGETVRLLKFARSADEVAEIAPFARRFGTRTRAVAELVGKASLRAFRTTVRLAELLVEWLGAVIAWFGSLLAGALATAGRTTARAVALRV